MFDAIAFRESLHLQDEVIHRLRAAGISDARTECPGFIWLPTHKKSFIHWHRESMWRDEKDAPLGEKNHQNAKEVADVILRIVEK